jgi:hypothetical protein
VTYLINQEVFGPIELLGNKLGQFSLRQSLQFQVTNYVRQTL